ncbi:methyltransferase domain protein [Aedoeadaptatus coxii]|uniref:Methyltransferase domain protein n=1 Tax=Aedoeadaptatus coxii TaxID=755172 RepID=A0A134ADJ0_9FIRM|nr:class I SAM-dependent methyltransferase [Peptoniphilus coxii]KXB65782.1 methyltransferase domain protein [Peptoniphilus coxii]
MNSYTTFSQLYDSVMDNYDYDRVFQWVSSFLPDDKKSEILEMAMGTGRLAEKLADSVELTGFDQSSDMLALAEERLRGRSVSLFQMDLRTFELRHTFDYILCLCDGMNYLADEGELLACFRRVREHLKEGGLFLFDMNTHARFLDYGDFTEMREEDDFTLIWENHYEPPVNEYCITMFIRNHEGKYDRYQEIHEERAFSRETVERLLNEAGLRLIDVYDGYKKKKAHDETERMCYVAGRN